jgi:hypothetical protein
VILAAVPELVPPAAAGAPMIPDIMVVYSELRTNHRFNELCN